MNWEKKYNGLVSNKMGCVLLFEFILEKNITKHIQPKKTYACSFHCLTNVPLQCKIVNYIFFGRYRIMWGWGFIDMWFGTP